jgi:hypothetical protein
MKNNNRNLFYGVFLLLFGIATTLIGWHYSLVNIWAKEKLPVVEPLPVHQSATLQGKLVVKEQRRVRLPQNYKPVFISYSGMVPAPLQYGRWIKRGVEKEGCSEKLDQYPCGAWVRRRTRISEYPGWMVPDSFVVSDGTYTYWERREKP